MNPSILILGGGGQVGSALAKLLGDNCLATRRNDIDLTDPHFISALTQLIGHYPITTIINASAYTAVDKAESEPELATRVNAEAVGELARFCQRRGIVLVHYSTDYVFDGCGSQYHCEDEPTAPLNVYGASKRVGEEAIAASGARHLIFRTSWVYDAGVKNFAGTMCRLFLEREEIQVVNDQYGAPTFAPQLAQATIQALSVAAALPEFPSGIYHLCGGGETNWFAFAKAIFALASAHESGIKCRMIHPISTTSYPTPAKRPLNSRLDCAKAKRLLSVTLPDWRVGLEAWAKERYEN